MAGSTIVAEVADLDLSRQPSLRDWQKELRNRLPGVVPRVLRSELIQATREFFTQSFLWRDVTEPMDIRAGRGRYVLSPATPYANVVSVLSVEIRGIPLRPVARKPTLITMGGDPFVYWMSAPDVIELSPTPTTDADDALTAWIALTPNPNVKRLPPIMGSTFYEALIDGTLGRLMSHPAKPYSNPPMAQYHLRRFRAAIAQARVVGKEGMTNSPMWRFPRFGK